MTGRHWEVEEDVLGALAAGPAPWINSSACRAVCARKHLLLAIVNEAQTA